MSGDAFIIEEDFFAIYVSVPCSVHSRSLWDWFCVLEPFRTDNKQIFNDFKFQIENKQKYVSKQIFVTRRFLH
jgi:hypothetical protein